MTDIEQLRAEIQQLKQDSTIFIIERGDAISQNADLREENTELRGEIERLRERRDDWSAAMTENHDLWRENERLRAELQRIANAAKDAAVWWLQDLAHDALEGEKIND